MLGGALGTLLRYCISIWISGNSVPDKFPWGTFTVNLTGSLIIGLLAGVYNNGDLSVNMKLFLFVGLLGGFTTFSSFSLECISLFRNGQIINALMYILGSNVLGLLLAAGGYLFGQSIAKA